ncbi:MAG TPA: hypothetical protein VKH44_00275, partial [Pirellulaceae bacterium]|nr:hypothetical protein [Pirellulaceae bacterium]
MTPKSLLSAPPRLRVIIFCLLTSNLIPSPLHAQQPYDIVIKNGRIVDGTGSPWYVADLGVRAG